MTNTSLVYADSVSAKPYIALGEDLKANEKDKVMQLLDLDGSLENYEVVTVSNQDEHNYLGSYLSSSVIGSRALSSVKIEKAEEGEGIQVETKNITYCTPKMYKNALTTAGVEDAYVTVVGPYDISGTSALVGVMKAYEDMTGVVISSATKDAATNELVVNSELADELGDSEKATEFLAFVKERVSSESGEITEDELDDIMEEGCEIYNVTLTEEQEAQVESLMKKIDDLDLNVDDLKEQARELYQEIKDSDMDTNGLIQKILDFLKKIFE